MSREPLTIASHEAFAQAVVRLETATDAYREVFKPELSVSNVAVWSMACRLKARTDVANRIGFLRAEALRHSQIEVVEMIHDLVDIIRADPNELMSARIVNCRHCHGEEHRYQWDGAEYAKACEDVEKANVSIAAKGGKPRELPDLLGGFGWDAMADPHPMCPNCYGAGVMHTIIADTTKLSRQGAKLYKGLKIKGNGDREVLMHDQMQARDQLHRLVGAYKDSLAIPSSPAGEVKPGADVHKTYLALVGGGRKSA
jgi:phage terminase small subunit